MLEPRGHQDLVGVLLTESVSPGFDAGLLFLDAAGSPPLHLTGVVAATTIALERAYLTSSRVVPGAVIPLSFDTPGGPVTVRADTEVVAGDLRVRRVTIAAHPSFVIEAGHAVSLGPRRVPIDLVWAGLPVAVVDGEAAGVSLQWEHLPELRRIGVDLGRLLDRSGALRRGLPAAGPALVVFTGPAHREDAHIRSVSVAASGAVDRSAGLTAVAALATVLHAMGLLTPGDDLVAEGLWGLSQRGRVTARVEGDERGAVVTEVESSAWITGEQLLLVSEDDPLGLAER
jgi:proline racemase